LNVIAQPNGKRRRLISAVVVFCQLLAGSVAVLHAEEHGAELGSAQVELEAAATGYTSHVPGCDICRVNAAGHTETRLNGYCLRLPASIAPAFFPQSLSLNALDPQLPPPARAPPAR
jgi:hypothetical protein